MRNFKDMSSDELYSMWNSYLQTDFGCGYDVLRHNVHPLKIRFRLTPMELHKIIEILFERLLEKEGYEPKKDEE
jgi:hypothetical protein